MQCAGCCTRGGNSELRNCIKERFLQAELLVLETAEGQHSKNEKWKRNPTLEPDFPRVSETGTRIASGNSVV